MVRGAHFLVGAAALLLCLALAGSARGGAREDAPVELRESSDMRKIDAILARIHGIHGHHHHAKKARHHDDSDSDSDSDSSHDSESSARSDSDSSDSDHHRKKRELHHHATRHREHAKAKAKHNEDSALAAMEAATSGLTSNDAAKKKVTAEDKKKQKLIQAKMKALEGKINKDFHKVCPHLPTSQPNSIGSADCFLSQMLTRFFHKQTRENKSLSLSLHSGPIVLISARMYSIRTRLPMATSLSQAPTACGPSFSSRF